MSTIILKAKSSSGEPYEVEFNISDSITVRCNCKAGFFGKLCKHKTGLLAGDVKFLFDTSERAKLDELLQIVQQSEYPSIEANLFEAKKAVDTAKKAESKIKRAVETALKEGINLVPES